MKHTYCNGSTVFEQFTIKRKLGEGSFGTVYEIQREDFGEIYKAALKVITVPKSDAEFQGVLDEGMTQTQAEEYFYSVVEDIVREFAIMSKFKGTANVVGYEDHRVIRHADGIGWDILIRMELLTPLLTYAYQHPFSRRDIIRLGIDMCRALELCQKYNVIHRDIKPENIFVSRFGDFKLGDFGIARELERTMSGFSKKGTYSYMAPEMYKGEKYDSRVDIYSLGIVLYRLMNHNRLPFMSLEKQFITYRDKENALNKRVAGEQMSAPVDAGTQFARIIMKACAYDPAQRYQTPEELYSALDDLKNGRSGRIRQLQNGVQKAGTDKTESYSAIAQNGRAAQNVTSDAENVRKSTVQNTSVQNTRGNKKTSDFQNAAKRKRAVNNVSESSFTDKETMSVVAEQKIQPQETPSETVAIRSARAVEARKRRRRKKQLLRRALLAIVAGTAILMMAAVYYRVSTDHAQEGQEDNPIAILDDEKYSSTKSGSKDFSKALDMIKEQATTITDNLNSYDWVGTEGTVLRYLRRVKTTQQADGNLDIESECMKALVYPAESGDGVYEEYFYWGEKLFFAYIWYDETSEYYYYNDGELIRWIDSNGKCHDNEKDNEEFVKRGEKYWNNSLKALKGEGTKTDNGNVSD